MYAFLTPGKNGDFTVEIIFCDTDLAAHADPTVVQSEIEKFKINHPKLELSEKFIFDATKIIPDFLVKNRADFALCLLAAFYSQNDEVKARRHEVVAQIYAANFGKTWESMMKGLGVLDQRMSSMNIMPEAYLCEYARWTCFVDSIKLFAKREMTRSVFDDKALAFVKVRKIISAMNVPREVQTRFESVLFGRTVADCGAWCQVLQSLASRTDKAWIEKVVLVQKHAQYLDTAGESSINAPHYDDAFVEFVSQIAKNEEVNEVTITDRCEQVQMESKLKATLVANATLEAVELGVDLGEGTAPAQAILDDRQKRRAKFDMDMLQALKRSSNGLAIASKGSSTSVSTTSSTIKAPTKGPAKNVVTLPAQPSLDPDISYHAWSVDKLAEWIGGPVGSITKKVDSKDIAQRSPHGTVPQPSSTTTARTTTSTTTTTTTTTTTKTAGKTPNVPKNGGSQPKSTGNAPLGKASIGDAHDASMKERDVDAVVQHALQTSARYFYDDICEMDVRAKALNLPPETTKMLHAIKDELQSLIDSTSVSETVASAVFAEAEAATLLVRQTMSQVVTDQSFKRDFPVKLGAALKSEPLVYGKRKGGVVRDSGYKEEYWTYVSSTFHNRSVEPPQTPLKDGVPTELTHEEALAFYVTGSSLSGYAFDVSVHLWRRRPESQALPHREDGFMDKDHWYDTLVDYCVLHVPHPKLP